MKNRTLANLSSLTLEKDERMRAVLRGDKLVAPRGVEVLRSLPHGRVAVLGVARRIGLDELLPDGPERQRNLALAMIVERLINPADEDTAINSLGVTFGLGEVRVNELYAALDWLGTAQASIEDALASRHLHDGALVLYDVSSSYVEGRCCELARFGHSRDHRRDRMQIVYGLPCAPNGCPIAIEVFEGNTGDPSTDDNQVTKLKERFGLKRVVLDGDRGMITQARIDNDLRPAGIDWITALRAPDIQQLAAGDGPLQLSLFDERDLAEICVSGLSWGAPRGLQEPRARRRAPSQRQRSAQCHRSGTEKIQKRVANKRNPLRGADQIGLAVGKVIGKRNVGKHFVLLSMTTR